MARSLRRGWCRSLVVAVALLSSATLVPPASAAAPESRADVGQGYCTKHTKLHGRIVGEARTHTMVKTCLRPAADGGFDIYVHSNSNTYKDEAGVWHHANSWRPGKWDAHGEVHKDGKKAGFVKNGTVYQYWADYAEKLGHMKNLGCGEYRIVTTYEQIGAYWDNSVIRMNDKEQKVFVPCSAGAGKDHCTQDRGLYGANQLTYASYKICLKVAVDGAIDAYTHSNDNTFKLGDAWHSANSLNPANWDSSVTVYKNGLASSAYVFKVHQDERHRAVKLGRLAHRDCGTYRIVNNYLQRGAYWQGPNNAIRADRQVDEVKVPC